ncbi:MAG: hypothetical protein NT162_01270, partial [Candidatus Woesebacteria bacterium]|nr:hypothetical protein [Candidatus Woesebacteria bacterium]
QQIRNAPKKVHFDHITPIVKEPFEPEDDAIVATNALEMRFFLEQSGAVVNSVSCTDRYVTKAIDFLLNATPLRYIMFNSFLIATRS